MFSQETINTFWYALSITAKGMGGIFVFMFIFYIIIQLMDKLFPKDAKKED